MPMPMTAIFSLPAVAAVYWTISNTLPPPPKRPTTINWPAAKAAAGKSSSNAAANIIRLIPCVPFLFFFVAEPRAQGPPVFFRQRVDGLRQRLQPPAHGIKLIEQVEQHRHRVLPDAEIAPQFDDQPHPRHVNLVKDIAFGPAFRQHPMLVNPVLELPSLDPFHHPAYRFEGDHGSPVVWPMARRGS